MLGWPVRLRTRLDDGGHQVTVNNQLTDSELAEIWIDRVRALIRCDAPDGHSAGWGSLQIHLALGVGVRQVRSVGRVPTDDKASRGISLALAKLVARTEAVRADNCRDGRESPAIRWRGL